MDYNEAPYNAVEVFERKLDEVDIQFGLRRQINGVVNAIMIVVEESGGSQVVAHLAAALRELIGTLDPGKQATLDEALGECMHQLQKYL